jgi:hypothetical protein
VTVSYTFTAHFSSLCSCGAYGHRGTVDLYVESSSPNAWWTLTMHRSGTGWAPCPHDLGGLRSSGGEDVTSEALAAVGALNQADIEKLTMDAAVRSSLEQATRYKYEKGRADQSLLHLRIADCRIFVLLCSNADVREAAFRMLDTWTGSAEDLIAAAEAVACAPEPAR